MENKSEIVKLDHSHMFEHRSHQSSIILKTFVKEQVIIRNTICEKSQYPLKPKLRGCAKFVPRVERAKGLQWPSNIQKPVFLIVTLFWIFLGICWFMVTLFLTLSSVSPCKTAKNTKKIPCGGQFPPHGYIILRNLSNVFIHGKPEGGGGG